MTRRTRLAALPVLAVLALATACSGSGSDGDAGASSDVAASSAEGGGRALAEAAAPNGFQAADAVSDVEAPQEERQVISTGTVALRADDVAEARLEVQEVVDRFRGEVAEEQTATDDDGEVKRARLVLRVPSDRFTEAVDALKGVAELVDASTASEDVTTKVLDVDIRVRVQRRSIERIEQLLDRAQSIRDIVSIEAQLSRRQAALASLEKQQAYLADQTAQSTLTVSIGRTAEEAAEPATDDAGFLAGLSAGWDGLVTTLVAAATVLGAVLPFALVGLVLGVPGVALLRRLRRRTASAG
ncbi:DUF4349 domain-containing protein [Nocardioides abyssi]|uniref:DUF4349 domain-containing protein n=1 Tax=Nocardioides abyssi TaxID=3058370 RepID=A0ABT8EPY4_9ACTN|nr:DUF4349 domain-containing protein [Nocardioides abyssi]MDN4160061.1 DUF4349 domain-containing protein [Nocardioides abyssi]